FPFLLALGAACAQWFAKKHALLASLTLCGTLLLAAGCYGWFRPSPAGPFLTIPAILTASVILPPIGTLSITFASLIMTAGIAWLRGSPAFSSTLYLGWLFSATTWILSYVATHNLQLAVQWANLSQKAALESLEGLRERRAELRRLTDLLRQNQERLHYLNIRLEQAKVAAEEAYRTKQHFVANVSHELRTPLNLITGFSELMAFSPASYGGIRLPAPYRQDVMEIWRSSKHLLSLVEDVLALAQLEAGQMIVKRDWGDLLAVIRDACETVAPLVEAKGLALCLDLPSSLPAAYIDAGRIRQVLLNLLNNAQRFTHEGKITVRAEIQGNEIIVSVSDTGVGIASEDLPHIFEEFRNLSKGSSSGGSGGFGLGLSISRRLVEAHGGRLWAESTLGQGSTFFLSLPLEAQMGALGRPTLIRTASRPSAHRRKPVLLVISDEEDDLLSRHLEDFEVVYASPHEVEAACEQYLPFAIWANRQPTQEERCDGQYTFPPS
ncbi:MAG: HAMP domain-containing histidine kinase, partial [Chloroflexi bacterium]|nr:HAMP domain-containing histidine kinase [Chloroflexota bacterium]